MLGVFSRSWEITKLSFNIIKQDKELLLFPLLSGFFSLLFLISMVLPTILSSIATGGSQLSGIEFLVMFIIYLGLAFIATFFNVCVVYTTKKRFEGGNATFKESLSYAMSKLRLILSWSLLAATVGIILRIIDRLAQRIGGAGQAILGLLNGILGMVWSIITIFVVPAMVYHDLGPKEAIKKSVEVLKKTWGESLIRYYGLGIIQFLFILAGAAMVFLLFFLLVPLGIIGVGIVILLGIVYLAIVLLAFSVANTVFNVALYLYAEKGKVPQGYTQEIMKSAFKVNQEKSMI